MIYQRNRNSQPDAAPPRPENNRQPSKGISLLVVDDEANFRKGIIRLLRVSDREHKFQLYEAGGAREAVQMLNDYLIDCVLLDFQMPEISGLLCLEMLLKENRHLAVIMITGRGDESTAVASMKSGAADYLVKGDISQQQLHRTILNAIEKSRLEQLVEAQRAQLIEAERQKVMVESLGGACHHLGQPATNIACYLELMHRQEASPEMTALINQCRLSVDTLTEVIQSLHRLTTYKTVSYLPSQDGDDEQADNRIIEVIANGA